MKFPRIYADKEGETHIGVRDVAQHEARVGPPPNRVGHKRIKTADLSGRVETAVELPFIPNAFGFRRDGSRLVGDAMQRQIHRWDGKALHPLVDHGVASGAARAKNGSRPDRSTMATAPVLGRSSARPRRRTPRPL